MCLNNAALWERGPITLVLFAILSLNTKIFSNYHKLQSGYKLCFVLDWIYCFIYCLAFVHCLQNCRIHWEYWIVHFIMCLGQWNTILKTQILFFLFIKVTQRSFGLPWLITTLSYKSPLWQENQVNREASKNLLKRPHLFILRVWCLSTGRKTKDSTINKVYKKPKH